MTRTDGFVRGVGFAAGAAIGSVAWLTCLAPVLGGRRALGLWLVAVVAAYVGGLAGRAHRRVALAIVTAGVGLAVLAVAPGIRELALALAVVLGVGRTAYVPRATALRAVATEAVLLAGGLALAATMSGPSLRGVAFATWGFFLVQSFCWLIPARGAHASLAAQVDPFDVAHARAVTLLQR